jgi:ribosomal protein S27AE
LNLLLAGSGYFLIRKPLIAIGILVIAGFNLLVPLAYVMQNPRARDAGGVLGFFIASALVWHGLMLFDMLMRRSKAKVATTTAERRACPQCAELVMIAAKKCRYCGSTLEK